jgi:hypothetical protein
MLHKSNPVFSALVPATFFVDAAVSPLGGRKLNAFRPVLDFFANLSFLLLTPFAVACGLPFPRELLAQAGVRVGRTGE